MRFPFVLFAMFASSLAAAPDSFEFGLPGQKPRPVLMHRPSGASDKVLLVVLHGGSRNAKLAMNDDSEGSWNEIADARGWTVIYPSGTTAKRNREKLFWNDCRMEFKGAGPESLTVNDVAYLDALIEKVLSEEKLDPKRVFLTGNSNGGAMTFRMALEGRTAFRAMAPAIMTIPKPSYSRCQDHWTRPIPTAYLLGTADPLVAFGGTGRSRSGSETLRWIRDKNGAKHDVARFDYPDKDLKDGPQGRSSSTITRFSYGPTPDSVNVLYFEVKDGGHNFPGPKELPRFILNWLGPKNRDVSIYGELAQFFTDKLRDDGPNEQKTPL